MTHPRVFGVGCLVVLGMLPVRAMAQAPDGAALFEQQCSSCHVPDGTQTPALQDAPAIEALRALTPNAIVDALTTGTMTLVGSVLSEDDRRAVATFLTGREVTETAVDLTAARCEDAAPFDPSVGNAWNGWGGGITNRRYQPRERGGLTAADVPRLKLLWAFGLPDVTGARAEPTVVGGRLFVGSESGATYALDAKTGCMHWTYQAAAGVRGAVSIAERPGQPGAWDAYFADMTGKVYAVDAATGAERWTRVVEDHPGVRISRSPTVYDGRLYVATAGLNEEGQGGRPNYECCTFRGSVSSLDAETGDVIWKSYTIPQAPQPRAVNSQGVQTWGPSGAGIWAAPTIDVARESVYVSTGNGYSDPPVETTDAIIAMDIHTGAIKWVYQAMANDVWTMGCQPENPDNPNCPERMGPDVDFSASPALATAPNGRDMLVIPQKSGMAYAVDPDDGSLIWEYRAGEGSGLGGIWGAAADDTQAYIGVGDFLTPNPGGLRAINLETGAEVWSMPPQERLCGNARGCSAAQGAAVTVIPGAVFSGSLDGGMRAYSTEDGTLIWEFDTNREFETVNGVPASGGSIDGPGVVAVDGMLYFGSGYGGLVGRPGNVLLAFGVE